MTGVRVGQGAFGWSIAIRRFRVLLTSLALSGGWFAADLPRVAVGAPPTPAMHLTFESQFDGLALPSTGNKIWTTTGGSGWRTLETNKEAEYYSDASVGVDPFSVSKGVLTISATPGNNPMGLPFNSGIVTTYRSFSQLYGYFEMRAQLPSGAGLWPAFWLLPVNGRWPPEIDVVEQIGSDPQTIYVGTHSAVGGANVATTTAIHVADTSEGFHVYGVDWQESEVAWYFDGELVYKVPTPADLHTPMYLLINLAVGGPGSWPGPPTRATVFPARFQVDYLRAYSR